MRLGWLGGWGPEHARHAAAMLYVGNGLGAAEPLVAATVRPRRLIAVNITHRQLLVGRDRLAAAGAAPVVADAVRLPFADGSVDGIVSVEAAFHFRSRGHFSPSATGSCVRAAC